jgi:hypothetical protein
VHYQRIRIAGLHPRSEAILPASAAPGYGQEAAGLVDDQQGVVNMKKFERDID